MGWLSRHMHRAAPWQQARGRSTALGQLSGPGALVVGGDFQGLGIVRSLGKRGVPVCVVDDEFSISRFSRWTSWATRVPSLRDELRTVETLLEIGRSQDLKDWVLYPTRDETVAAFSRYRTELGAQFRVPTPDWETIQWVWDKRKTYELAGRLGIPTPQTWYAHDRSDLAEIEMTRPMAIKPAIKEHFIYETKAKAWRADTREELAELYQRASQLVGCDEVMIQEFIPGDGRQQFAYCAFFKNGDAVGSMVTRRRRQHPPEFGRASTFVETIDLPLLERLSERFLRAIKYYGLVEVEYKLDPLDGQYKLLDVNARTWGYHTLGQPAGVDFPYMLFADQIGKPVEAQRGRPGVRWIRLISDLPTGFIEIHSRQIHWRDYLRSLTHSDTEAVFSREDPLPGLAEVALIPYLYVKRGF